nr:hypothetical protein [Methylobacterium sp. ZNC0032]
MINGIGSITLRSGRTLPVTYQFGAYQEHHWVGYLIVATEHTDPSEFSYKVLLHSEGGVAVELAVTNWNDRYMMVVGRPLPQLDRAA